MHEHWSEVIRSVTDGLDALRSGDRERADASFRHAVHVCADAAAVAEEIIRQSDGRL